MPIRRRTYCRSAAWGVRNERSPSLSALFESPVQLHTSGMKAAADNQDNNGSERNLTLAAYDGLLTQIISGELPGGTIIEERALLPVLGVSRTPLQEALGCLQGEGFLVRQRRKLVVHQFTDRDFIEI